MIFQSAPFYDTMVWPDYVSPDQDACTECSHSLTQEAEEPARQVEVDLGEIVELDPNQSADSSFEAPAMRSKVNQSGTTAKGVAGRNQILATPLTTAIYRGRGSKQQDFIWGESWPFKLRCPKSHLRSIGLDSVFRFAPSRWGARFERQGFDAATTRIAIR